MTGSNLLAASAALKLLRPATVAVGIRTLSKAPASPPPSSGGAKPAQTKSPAVKQQLDRLVRAVESMDKAASTYKNPEYFVFDGLSYYDYEMLMESKRLPQPKSALTAF